MSESWRTGTRPWLSRLVKAVGAAAFLLPLAAAGQGPARPATRGTVAAVAGPAARGAAAARGVQVVAAGDSPPGFWYGTDSFTMPVTGTGPYKEPVIGGNYGGYIGMTGNWAHWQGCGGELVWSATDASQAATNFSTSRMGVGTAAYWFMAGPGVDPNYDGTVAEAKQWGQRQAARALADMRGAENYPVVWMDVELPGNAPRFTPAPDNGWNAVYTSPCSGQVKTQHIAPDIDRGVLDGFAAYLTAHSGYKPGVYSAPPVWTAIFGPGSASKIPGLYEWTYTAETSSLTHHPSAWCLKSTSTCAHFFGGQHGSDATALMWQRAAAAPATATATSTRSTAPGRLTRAGRPTCRREPEPCARWPALGCRRVYGQIRRSVAGSARPSKYLASTWPNSGSSGAAR